MYCIGLIVKCTSLKLWGYSDSMTCARDKNSVAKLPLLASRELYVEMVQGRQTKLVAGTVQIRVANPWLWPLGIEGNIP